MLLKNFSVWHFHSLQLEEKMEVKYYRSAGVEKREQQRIEKNPQNSIFLLNSLRKVHHKCNKDNTDNCVFKNNISFVVSKLNALSLRNICTENWKSSSQHWMLKLHSSTFWHQAETSTILIIRLCWYLLPCHLLHTTNRLTYLLRDLLGPTLNICFLTHILIMLT